MGKNNSSETRVRPMAEHIMNNKGDVDILLHALRINITFGDFDNSDIYFTGNNHKEKTLYPTIHHLDACIDYLVFKEEYKSVIEKQVSPLTKEKRTQIIEGNQDTIQEGKNRLRKSHKAKGWWILEGPSRPDLYIENKDYILLVEGKRTEANTTNEVSYLDHRSQMVRHIQNALAQNTGKRIIAFYVVDGECHYLEKCTVEHFKQDINTESIPLSYIDKLAIAGSFYGYLTWDDVTKLLKISFT